MGVTFTTIRDVEMVVWAAYGGSVMLAGGRVATLVHWSAEGTRCLVAFSTGRRLRVAKADVERTFGFVTIGGQTYS